LHFEGLIAGLGKSNRMDLWWSSVTSERLGHRRGRTADRDIQISHLERALRLTWFVLPCSHHRGPAHGHEVDREAA